MVAVKIKALSPKGEKALRKGLSENKGLQKKLFKEWYTLGVVKEKPFTLIIAVKSGVLLKFMSYETLISPLVVALSDNGAKKDVDYLMSKEGN